MAEKQVQPFIPYQTITVRDCFRIPACLFRSGILSLGELILWASLANFALFDGNCYPTINALVEDTNLSERSVNRHKKALIKKGFLRIRSRSTTNTSRRSNSYELLQHQVFDPVVKNQPNSAQLAQPQCQTGTFTSANLASKKEERKSKKETTTTRRTSENPAVFAASEPGGCGFSLSEKQSHYIQLQVEFTAAHGDLRKPPRRLEKTLVRLATEGKLDMSDYSDLVKWKSAQAAPRQNEACFTLPDKAALHAGIEAVDREARKWLASLPHTHPANSETKPSLMSEGVWIRSQYQKYHQSEGIKDVA